MSDGSLTMGRAERARSGEAVSGPARGEDGRDGAGDEKSRAQSAFPFDDFEGSEPHALVADPVGGRDAGFADDTAQIEPSRALALADFAPPRTGPLDAMLRWAYRVGISPTLLASPLRKPAKPRLLATVQSPLSGESGIGERGAGMALRAGHFLVNGVRAPIAQMEFGPAARLTPPFARRVHGFGWLRDLSACAPREQCAAVAERILGAWLDANPQGTKGPAWTVERAGQRLIAWLVHAPFLLAGEQPALRPQLLEAMVQTARWLDRHVESAEDRFGALTGWCAIVAAGLLLPDGRARRVYGEAGMLRALGEAVSDDGGVLSRSPLAQMDAIALLVDLTACYDAVGRTPPPAIEAMLGLLVPPLLALRHGDGGLGSWQGAAATPAAAVEALIAASGVRARPARDCRQWGYQLASGQISGGARSVLQFDAAPPPRPRHARFGCASTLAFEFSHGDQRIVVNCGGAELAGGQVPVRIEQGLRATAAHSTLVLDDANSTAILIKGQIGKGVEEVDFARSLVDSGKRKAERLEASHDGYASRFGLIHRRILMLSSDGGELRGEDILEPAKKRGQRGKIGFAIRFHIGPHIELMLAEDRRGAGLALPDGSYWQLRLGGVEGELGIEESLWVDGEGRPQPIQQLVVEGLTSRGGGSFPWLLKKMG